MFFVCVCDYFSDENDIALVPLNLTKSRSNNLHHSHQHIFQHQSSVSSTASVQTVFHNVDTANGDYHNSVNGNHNTNNITTTSNNQMILVGTSSSSASFQSANGTAYSVHTNGTSMGKFDLFHFCVCYCDMNFRRTFIAFHSIICVFRTRFPNRIGNVWTLNSCFFSITKTSFSTCVFAFV